jgi:hypothetical protein
MPVCALVMYLFLLPLVVVPTDDMSWFMHETVDHQDLFQEHKKQNRTVHDVFNSTEMLAVMVVRKVVRMFEATVSGLDATCC